MMNTRRSFIGHFRKLPSEILHHIMTCTIHLGWRRKIYLYQSCESVVSKAQLDKELDLWEYGYLKLFITEGDLGNDYWITDRFY